MNRSSDGAARSPFSGESHYNGGPRNIPILPSSTTMQEPPHPDPMEVTPPTSASMGPPINSSPDMDQSAANNSVVHTEAAHMSNGSGNALSAAAAASSQQPKVVQTAFIHKLYK